MPRHQATYKFVERRMAELIAGFERYIGVCEDRLKFTGPSVYFTRRSLERLREVGGPEAAVQDLHYVEYLYATLASWGMHRMGKGGAKMAPFQTFAASLRACGPDLERLRDCRLAELSPGETTQVTTVLWDLISRVKPSATRSLLVGGSKTLYHLLPELVPPIDREYTGAFFLWQGLMQGADQKVFEDIFPRLATIARSIRRPGEPRWISAPGYSLAKQIDDAIIGDMISHGEAKE